MGGVSLWGEQGVRHLGWQSARMQLVLLAVVQDPWSTKNAGLTVLGGVQAANQMAERRTCISAVGIP